MKDISLTVVKKASYLAVTFQMTVSGTNVGRIMDGD